MKRLLVYLLYEAAGAALRLADAVEPPRAWPAGNLACEALRNAWPERGDDDRPAALSMNVDPDGMVHSAPLTVDDALAWASVRAHYVLGGGAPWEAVE